MSARDATESIEQLLQSLEQLEHGYLEGKADDLAFLRDMLKTPEFKYLLKAHHAVSESTGEDFPLPVSPSAVTLANVVSYDAENALSAEERELHQLLSSPHISAIIATHDKVANKEYPLQLAEDTMDAGKGSDFKANGPIRVVYLKKKEDPLGATVRCNDDKQIVISRVLAGGVASRSGVLHPGDIVHEINDKSLEGWSIDGVATFMQTLTGTVKFKISPILDEFTARKRLQDRHHPCQEAGLSLERGEMLRVVDQDDPEWWQAIKEGEGPEQVGLIPSKKYMEWIRTYSSVKKKRLRDKAKPYSTYESEPVHSVCESLLKDLPLNCHVLGKEVVTYEEMTKVEPQSGRPRPIMLIAPRNGPFSLEDLKQKIIVENSATFGVPIPHTTRPTRSGEVSGKNYFFIQRSQMERDILNGEIIEHAFLNGHYYGTSVNSIRRIMNSGKTCLLVLDPQAIKLVRTSELRPFIVYFTTPTAEFMKKNWAPSKKIKDSAVLDIVRQATYLEKSYSHYFDHYIPFEDIDSAHRDVAMLANSLQTNQQWVPSGWLKQ